MEAALALFAATGKEYAFIQGLRHQRARLWLEVNNNWTASEQDLRKTARFCVPKLAAISAALQARQMGLPGKRKALFGAATELLLAAAAALACVGAVQLCLWMLGYLFLGSVPYTLDQAALLIDALSLSGALLLALLLAGFLLAGKSARAHLVFSGTAAARRLRRVRYGLGATALSEYGIRPHGGRGLRGSDAGKAHQHQQWRHFPLHRDRRLAETGPDG